MLIPFFVRSKSLPERFRYSTNLADIKKRLDAESHNVEQSAVWKSVETWSLIMASNPFDFMIDDWSFEIAQLTSNGTGLMSA